MSMKERAIEIFNQSISDQRKIKLLNDLQLDCYNEMEAEEQNMRPEVEHDLAEGYRVAGKYLNRLQHK